MGEVACQQSYEEYLAHHDSLTYTNVGTSMLPLLSEGRDLFTVVSKGKRRCSAGDVVLYRRPPTHYVLHRVVKVLPGGYLTRGDNCVACERVPEDDVIGVMTGFVRDGCSHSVDERRYRLYVWVWLHSAGIRATFGRVCRALCYRLGRHAHGG